MAVGHRVEGHGHGRAVADIDLPAPDLAALPAPLGQVRDRAVQPFGVDVEDADPRALVQQDLGIGAADAAGPAGDDHGFTAQVEHRLK